MIKPNRKNYDSLSANANRYERARQMKADIKAMKRKSPDVAKMYSIEIPAMRITYYFGTAKIQKNKILELTKRYPMYDLVVKNPIK